MHLAPICSVLSVIKIELVRFVDVKLKKEKSLCNKYISFKGVPYAWMLRIS